MAEFTLEELDKALTHKLINVVNHTTKGETFERKRMFTLREQTFIIEWYINVCYLYIEKLTIPFHSVKQSGTWPNSAKLNLQFYNASGEACAILELESFPKGSSHKT